VKRQQHNVSRHYLASAVFAGIIRLHPLSRHERSELEQKAPRWLVGHDIDFMIHVLFCDFQMCS
jgi:hypothetical protein